MATTTQTKSSFTDSAFVRSHMRSPRGNGTWAFQATTNWLAFDAHLTGDIVFRSGTLRDAKAALPASPTGCWAILP